MTEWVWLIIAFALSPVVLALFWFVFGLIYFRQKYLDHIVRIFEEKPLFIVPRGQPLTQAEDVAFTTADGFQLRGCYLNGTGPRKGVILFGLEFGSNRWAAVQYCSALLASGYDVFAFEPRNQGDSEKDPSYDPLQWVTDKDLIDSEAALAYLKSRPDAPSTGIGLLGVSKGGSVGMLLAASDPWVRCVVTDGAYATHTTMIPYMQRWVHIYSKSYPKLRKILVPTIFYSVLGRAAVRKSGAKRNVRFLDVEESVRRMKQPLFMIHGGADNYIKPEMAGVLFEKAKNPNKTLWLVPGAKHNQGLRTANDEYHRKLIEFFNQHLAVAILDPQSESVALAAAGAGAK